MASNQRIICSSEDVVERSKGVRFKLPEIDERATGFIVRYNAQVYAYVNQCAHVPIELDWNEGDFFNITQDYLICSTHGAQYQPESGYCVLGPCKGRKLRQIPVFEQNNEVWIDVSTLIRF